MTDPHFTPPPPPPPRPQLPPGYWAPGMVPPKKHMPRWQIVLIVVTALLALTSGADWWSPGGDGPPAAFGLLCALWVSVIIGWIVVGEKRYPGLARAMGRAVAFFLTFFAIGAVLRRILDRHNGQ